MRRAQEYRILFYLSFAVVGLAMSACTSATDPFEPYIKNKVPMYPQLADTIIARSGYKRVKLKIVKPTDPNVNGVVVFCAKTDSLKATFFNKKDTLEVEIDSLNQGVYTFHVYTTYKSGERSIGQAVTQKVYGSFYVNRIKVMNRKLVSIKPKGGNYVLFKWGGAGVGVYALGTILKYTNKSDKIDSVFVPIDSTHTLVSNLSRQRKDSTVKYYTMYLPPTSIDTFYTNVRTVNVYSALHFVNNIFLNKSVKGDRNTYSSYPYSNMVDGDKSTRMATHDCATSPCKTTTTFYLEGEYKLDILTIYSFDGSRSDQTTIDLYYNGKWQTIIDKQSLNKTKTRFNLQHKKATKVRITWVNSDSNKGQTIYEVICSGVKL